MPAKKVAKKVAKKATTERETLSVNFEEDIPKIVREGTNRKSKYGEFLDKVRERAESDASKKVAVLTFDTQGKATSRYTSIKDAVAKRDDADHWTVAVRNKDGEFRLYVKWSEEAQSEEDETEE